MENRHPASRASWIRSSGGSCRSGRELISTATLCSAHAANTLGRRIRTGAGFRAIPPPGVRCSGPARWCADPGCRPACAAVMVLRSDRSFEWTLATTMSRRSSISGSLVQFAVLQDVHLDPGQERKPFPPVPSLIPATTSSCSVEALRGEPVGDLQVGRVVRQRQVLPAQRPRGPAIVDGGPAVGPVAVAVEVAAEGGQELGCRPSRVALCCAGAGLPDSRAPRRRPPGGSLRTCGPRSLSCF